MSIPASWLDDVTPEKRLYILEALVPHLISAERWDELCRRLTTPAFLEAKVEAGMVFDLAADLRAAVGALPRSHDWCRIIALLEDALRRDVHFIARHAQDYPQALFQCLWNSCWWHDAPEASQHYDPPPGGWPPGEPPWERLGPKVSALLEQWRGTKEAETPKCVWLRALRPPAVPLGTAAKAVIRAHEGGVKAVLCSPDGQHIASGSADRTIRIWDAITCREVRRIVQESQVNCIAYSPDGSRIVSGGKDRLVRLYDTMDGRLVWRFCAANRPIAYIAFSPDGQRIICTAQGDQLGVIDARTGEALHWLRGHEAHVSGVAFWADGRHVASGSWDGTIRVWDIETGEELRRLIGDQRQVSCLAVSADGSRVVSGSRDGTVRVWDAESGVVVRCLARGGGPIRSVLFLPGGKRIGTGGGGTERGIFDFSVRLWDIDAEKELSCLAGHTGEVSSLALLQDGRTLISGSDDRTVRFWDVEASEMPYPPRGHAAAVGTVQFSQDGRHLVSTEGRIESPGRSTMRVWDAQNGRHLYFKEEQAGRLHVAFAHGGPLLVSGSSEHHNVRVWATDTGAEVRRIYSHEDNCLPLYCLEVSPDGKRLACGITPRVFLWDIESGKEVALADAGWDAHCYSVCFSSDGTWIAAGSSKGRVYVWHTGSKTAPRCLHTRRRTVPERSVASVAIAHDGSLVASSSNGRDWDFSIRLSNTADGRELGELRGHRARIAHVAFMKDALLIVSSSDDGTTRVWDPATARCLELTEGKGDVRAVAAGPSRFPLRAFCSAVETQVRTAEGGPVAWFPEGIEHITTHPSGLAWAGAVGNHILIMQVEGWAVP